MKCKTAYAILSDDKKYITYDNFPAYALPYIVNADSSGYEDEDIEAIDEFMKREELGDCVDWSEEEFFCSRPAFGLATNCVEATFEYYGK